MAVYFDLHNYTLLMYYVTGMIFCAFLMTVSKALR